MSVWTRKLVFACSKPHVRAWSGHFCPKQCQAIWWRLSPADAQPASKWLFPPRLNESKHISYFAISLWFGLLSGWQKAGFQKLFVSSMIFSDWSYAELGQAILWWTFQVPVGFLTNSLSLSTESHWRSCSEDELAGLLILPPPRHIFLSCYFITSDLELSQ